LTEQIFLLIKAKNISIVYTTVPSIPKPIFYAPAKEPEEPIPKADYLGSPLRRRRTYFLSTSFVKKHLFVLFGSNNLTICFVIFMRLFFVSNVLFA